MATFSALQPLRLAAAQGRAVQLRAFSNTAMVRAASELASTDSDVGRPKSQDARRGFQSREPRGSFGSREPRRRDRDGQQLGQDKWSGSRRPRERDVANGPWRKHEDATGIAQLLDTLATLKEEGRTPTAAAYMALITAAADYHKRRGRLPDQGPNDWSLGLEIALAAARDAHAGGIELGAEAVDEFMRFSHLHPDILPSLIAEMLAIGKATEKTYNNLAAHAASRNLLDSLVMVILEMMDQGFIPSRAIMRSVAVKCAELGLPRLAIDIINKVKEKDGNVNPSQAAWIAILMSSADCQYHEGTKKAWAAIVSNKAYTPDEGLILAVLAVAGRWGDTELAMEALSILPVLQVQPKEHHLAPLLEAYCRDGKVPEAFKVVTSMRDNDIDVSMSTVKPIVDVLSTAELVDQAFYNLEDTFKAGGTVDVAVLNALIQASANQGDIQRARANQTAAAELGVTPNIDTINLTLEACAQARQKELGDSILADLEAAGLSFNAQTYTQMIYLCLTQKTYEDAFYYLEKMKLDGFRPSQEVYNRIGGKLAANEDGRWRLVADEMVTLGYGKVDFEREFEDNLKRRQDRAERGNQRDQRGGNGRRNGERRDAPREDHAQQPEEQ